MASSSSRSYGQVIQAYIITSFNHKLKLQFILTQNINEKHPQALVINMLREHLLNLHNQSDHHSRQATQP